MDKKKQKRITFDAWLDEMGAVWVARKLKVHPHAVRLWRRKHNDPRVDHMRRIKRLTKGVITYEMMIDRRPITTKGTYSSRNPGVK